MLKSVKELIVIKRIFKSCIERINFSARLSQIFFQLICQFLEDYYGDHLDAPIELFETLLQIGLGKNILIFSSHCNFF